LDAAGWLLSGAGFAGFFGAVDPDFWEEELFRVAVDFLLAGPPALAAACPGFTSAAGDAVDVLELTFFLLLEGFFAMVHSLTTLWLPGLGASGLQIGRTRQRVR
jgi:hypothetical protein